MYVCVNPLFLANNDWAQTILAQTFLIRLKPHQLSILPNNFHFIYHLEALIVEIIFLKGPI